LDLSVADTVCHHLEDGAPICLRGDVVALHLSLHVEEVLAVAFLDGLSCGIPALEINPRISIGNCAAKWAVSSTVSR
jgi:hypothetical protein